MGCGPAPGEQLIMERTMINSALPRSWAREFTETLVTGLEIGGGNVRKERFQTRAPICGTNNAFAGGPKEDISTVNGDAIPPMKIRMHPGRTRSGGAHTGNAGKENILV